VFIHPGGGNGVFRVRAQGEVPDLRVSSRFRLRETGDRLFRESPVQHTKYRVTYKVLSHYGLCVCVYVHTYTYTHTHTHRV